MDQMRKEELIQAVLVADNFNETFTPMTQDVNSGLIPLVNTPMIDYALEALNRSGVEEVFVFCSTFMDQVKKHIQHGIIKKYSWSIKMNVQVVGSEGCRCLGDALRDLDAKGLIRGHFILMGCDTMTNAQLGPILEQHKRNCKLDKGAAMTVVFKKTSPGNRTGNEVVVATDKDTDRLLFHQRLSGQHKERQFEFPLEIFLVNSEVVLRHDLLDPQIAICAPSALPLFADNFDFATRDDFIRGLLINEEILASTIYFSELPVEQYAARVSDWQSYQLVSNDIINRWAFPMVPDMGICLNRQIYMFLRNNVYRSSDVQLARSSVLKENVVIREGGCVDEGTSLANSVVGLNCKIGKDCVLENVFLFDGVVIEDKCVLRHCVIGAGSRVQKGSRVEGGAVIGYDVNIPEESEVLKHFVQNKEPDFVEGSIRLGPHAFTIPDDEQDVNSDSEDEENDTGIVRMSGIHYHYASSAYSSSSDDSDSRPPSPIQEDSNIFLSEVIDSLNRGFDEKSNPDFLILEINSSRYAYNMSLTEVNFFVVKAVLALRPIVEAPSTAVLAAFKQVMTHLAPMFRNYIRGDDAQRDCLKAIQETCEQNEVLRARLAQLIHYLYDQEILGEDAILAWHQTLVDDDDDETKWIRVAMKKLIDWLEASSDEDSSDEEDDDDD